MLTIILLIALTLLAAANLAVTLAKNFGNDRNRREARLLDKIDGALSETERLIRGEIAAEHSKIDRLIRDEFSGNRSENRNSLSENRIELNNALKNFSDSLAKNLGEIRETVEQRLKTLQDGNDKKLEEMRKTVDEKLQETVERRFTESFKLISDRLEQVHKGLGEMQTLASGVDDLRKVLGNVKTRGNLGEFQLGAILEQILSPEQYDYNASVKDGSRERIEYVVKLPGRDGGGNPLLLPIDSKFPNEAYQRLQDAYDGSGDTETASREFENSIKKNAKDIREKYINPPITTDFAIMFVPTEGLYAEILRRTGLFETLQRDFKVTVVGPTNLVAFLSSLQMGFKTLAIEKRSSEVWEILGAVKTEFGKFGDVLEKTRDKLKAAANEIDNVGTRSRAIERKLKDVEKLPGEQTAALLGEGLGGE
jgi:DNA recombination protein RmuC